MTIIPATQQQSSVSHTLPYSVMHILTMPSLRAGGLLTGQSHGNRAHVCPLTKSRIKAETLLYHSQRFAEGIMNM